MMTNITFSVPEELVKQARRNAAARGTTLNEEFRDWLTKQDKMERAEQIRLFEESFKKIHFTSERKFTREEMNER